MAKKLIFFAKILIFSQWQSSGFPKIGFYWLAYQHINKLSAFEPKKVD
jgi:hypothetical protein